MANGRVSFCVLRVALFVTILPGFPAAAFSSVVIHATAAAEPPEVDGIVGSSEWSAAVPISGFIQQQPDESAPSTETTVVRVLFDERNLYLGIVCFDGEPDRIVVTQSRRDGDLTDSDSVQIVLDTFNDDQNAFLFGTNPLGVEYDGQVASEGSAGGALSGVGAGFGGGGSQRGQLAGFNRNWDGDWSVAARITEQGWEAELAISVQNAALSRRGRRGLGVQRDAEHSPQERAGLSRARPPRVQHLPRFPCR